MAGVAYVCLGFFGDLDVKFTTGLLFCIVFQAALCDLLTEAQYAEKLKANPESGPSLMSFVWGGLLLCPSAIPNP